MARIQARRAVSHAESSVTDISGDEAVGGNLVVTPVSVIVACGLPAVVCQCGLKNSVPHLLGDEFGNPVVSGRSMVATARATGLEIIVSCGRPLLRDIKSILQNYYARLHSVKGRYLNIYV
jgi:hypothetical protein